jgi:hypothetical protein
VPLTAQAFLWSVLDTTICDKVCQWLETGWWFSHGALVSFINKIDRHDITELLLKVVLNTINLNQASKYEFCCYLLFHCDIRNNNDSFSLTNFWEHWVLIIISGIQTHNISGDRGTDSIGSCKSKYHMITTTPSNFHTHMQIFVW